MDTEAAEATDGGYERAGAAYAEGLRAAYQHISDSYRTFARRQDVPFDYTAVSRFLSGDRVAPPEFLECLASVRRAVGVPLTEEEGRGLRALWLSVMEASRNPQHRLAYLEHQLDVVREQLAQAEEQAGSDRGRLEASRARLEALQEELDTARRSADRAAGLREENSWLRRQLRAAADYVRDTERQLEESEHGRAGLEEQVRLLEHEVAVLRRQVNALEQEAQARVTEVTGDSEAGKGTGTAAGTVGAVGGASSDVLVLTLPRTISRLASHRLTRRQRGALWSAAAGACVLLPLWITDAIDWFPGLDYADGDTPSETNKSCNLETGCMPAYWSWEIPSGGEIETTYWLDISDERQQPRGTLNILNGDRCTGSVEWTISAGSSEVASGTVTGTTTESVTGTAPTHSGQLTLSARRADNEDCLATLTWTDARVD
ncbi:hypothetical protein ACIQAC_36630 [Streptomyces sp. NPDC088387]|uniref:hypothetical protein n=1 Tax=Streptomyces sp. NPDC088387 TaxID=3365859 RepID=UPI0038286977